MTAFPGSPRLIKGGIVLIDDTSGAVQRIITLQYNPDTVTRTLQVQGVGPESGDRLEALRLKAPAQETIKLDAEIDATDQLEVPDQNQLTTQVGIYAQLAALETIIYPQSSLLVSNNVLASLGTLEVFPIGSTSDPLHVEQAAHYSRAHNRANHHRRGVRPCAQPDPSEG